MTCLGSVRGQGPQSPVWQIFMQLLVGYS